MSNPTGANRSDRAPARGLCACGAQAVDRFQGRLLCAACLCPAPTADQLRAERIYYMTRGTGNLGQAIGTPRYEKVEARALCRAIDAAMAKRGVVPRRDERYFVYGAAEARA